MIKSVLGGVAGAAFALGSTVAAAAPAAPSMGEVARASAPVSAEDSVDGQGLIIGLLALIAFIIALIIALGANGDSP